MKAVVLGAGKGTRMRPLTETRPKPMLPIAGKPLLEHVLDMSSEYVDGFVIVVGYESDMIRDYFGDRYNGVRIDYVEQKEQLGTAHAIGHASQKIDERFMVLNGDILITSNLTERLSEHEVAITVKNVENPSDYGVVSVENGHVGSIVEKPDDPPSNLANLGLYVFPSSVFDYIDATPKSERGEYEITDTIQAMIDDGYGFDLVEHDGRWLDVGYPWDLLSANTELLSEIDKSVDVDGKIEDNTRIKGDVIVENRARIRSGTYIEGPVIVKEGADVGPNAYIRGYTVIGENARVGNSVEVKNSIFMNGATAGHLSYVGDSVIGADANLGAGTVVANLRHDDKNVRMNIKGKLRDTGRRKMGVVLGDRVKTGINTSLNAGVKMEVGKMTRPGESLMEDR